MEAKRVERAVGLDEGVQDKRKRWRAVKYRT